MSTEVVRAENQYEIHVDGSRAGFVVAREEGDTIVMPHTEIDEAYEGQGLAKTLVTEALNDIRERGKKIVPHCPYVKRFLEKNPEYADLVAP